MDFFALACNDVDSAAAEAESKSAHDVADFSKLFPEH
jgi:hypothetical protein